MTVLVRLIAVGLIAALAACNTVDGVGRDLQIGGQAVSDSAQDAQTHF